MICFPAGLALANAGVSPWKEYYYNSSSFSFSSSSHNGSCLSVKNKSFKEIKEIIQDIYPLVTNIKIKSSWVECFVENENIPNGFHFEVRKSNVYEIDEICFGSTLDDDRWMYEIYEERRKFINDMFNRLKTKSHKVYYVKDEENKVVTPYFETKELAQEWINKQPSTAKFLWIFEYNKKYKIESKEVWY